MPFSGRVGGGPGTRYKKQTLFWKCERGARGTLTKMTFLEGWEGEAWGPERPHTQMRPFLEGGRGSGGPKGPL